MTDFAFAPADPQIPISGQFELINEGTVDHNFTLNGAEEGFNIDLAPGESRVIDARGIGEGTFGFFCRFHEGMAGNMLVGT
jgi:plastocyanin